jgi:hypothetical protein
MHLGRRTALHFLVAALLMAAGSVAAPPRQADAACAAAPGQLDCDFQERIATAESYLTTRPGSVGFVLRDRGTGAHYRNGQAGDLVWTASTIKLAMVVDLLSRERAGQLRLTESDRAAMAAMLHSSDDDAADTLWARYSGADHESFNRNFPGYGMTDLTPQRGFSTTFPYWGFQKSTADDLDRLMSYTLTRLPPAQTAQIVTEMQHVDPVQQWGGEPGWLRRGRRDHHGTESAAAGRPVLTTAATVA